MAAMLWPYIRRRWAMYAFGFLCLIGTASLAMAIPFMVRLEINCLERGEIRLVPYFTLLICVTAVLMGLVRWVSRFVIFNCGRDIEYELRRDLFARLLRLGPDFYHAYTTGDLMSRMVNVLTAVRLLVGFGILTAVNAPLYYLYAMAIMLSLNAKLTVLTLLPFGLVLLIVRRLARSLMERTLEVQQGLGQISAKVQETLFGIHVVKAYALEEQQAKAFIRLNEIYNSRGLALARLRAAIAPLMRMAATFSVVVVLMYDRNLMLSRQISVGDLAGFMGYLTLLASPTTSLAWVISIHQRGRAAMSRLMDILNAPVAAELDHDQSALLEVQGEIEWDNVWFSYSKSTINGLDAPIVWALRGISLKVPAGSKLAIVGRTGAGKTTMVNLLLRLIEPTRGRILLDGQELGKLPLRFVRRVIGGVPQTPTIFSDTLARNIAFARPEQPATIAAAAYDAGLEQDLAAMPQGLDTIVGERGMSLSGGQKQRVAIARLLAYDPRVIVLDDALSSVDTQTEMFVLQKLARRRAGRTTIVVSHRISAIRDADQIVVLEHGAIVEQGTHDELIAREGIYAELFRRQMLEEELAQY